MAEFSREECAAAVLDGPTAVIDLGGLRIVSDPTFDDAGPSGYLTKLGDSPVSAAVLGSPVVIPAHYDGWAHFSEGRAEIELAFEEAGLSGVLRSVDHGVRVDLRATAASNR